MKSNAIINSNMQILIGRLKAPKISLIVVYIYQFLEWIFNILSNFLLKKMFPNMHSQCTAMNFGLFTLEEVYLVG